MANRKMQPIFGVLIRDALREARHAGLLKAIKLGRRWYYRGNDLKNWIEQTGTGSQSGDHNG